MKRELVLIGLLFFVKLIFSQEVDTTTTMITTESQSHIFKMDSLGKDESYSLDIGKDRGLFILTPDKKMQLRILGSIRFMVQYDFINNPNKKSFNPYYIPLGEERVHIPNYYGDLNQSRFGFEVTRLLNENNSIFIRLEMDFNGGSTGDFRIRHAYGQLNRFLIGQTYSLFSNVTALPSSVNFDGPVGSVDLRTPQMRYFGSNRRGTRWAVALEYSRPDIDSQVLEENDFSAVQVIPDFTARFEREGILGAVQLSGVMTTLSVLDEDNKASNEVGFGGSLSGTVDLKHGQVLYQLTYGKAISHFITTFSGTGNDAVYNPETGEVEPLKSFGGYLAYDFKWRENIASNVALGYANLNTKDFQPDTDFKQCMSASFNTFWQITKGTKLGLEYIFGKLWTKGPAESKASRIGALFYYDF